MIEKLKKWLAKGGERETYRNPLTAPRPRYDYLTSDGISMVVNQALGGSTTALFTLYRDMVLTHAHIQAEFNKRKMAVIGPQMNVMPYDSSLPADTGAADFVESEVYRIPGFTRVLVHLLDATLWPVSVVEKVWKPEGAGFRVAELVPVPHHLLDYGTGALRIKDTTPEGKIMQSTHEPEPERYIVHRGALNTADDTFGGTMRSLVWWWLFSSMGRDWWSQFLERWGTPFLIGHYPAGSQKDRDVMEDAFALAVRLRALVISDKAKVEIMEAAKGGAAEYHQFLTLCNEEISKVICGQTLSSTAASTGELGGGTANLQATVRQDIRAFDESALATTLRDQLFRDMLLFSHTPGDPPTVRWGETEVSMEQKQALASMLAPLKAAGLTPDDEALQKISDILGFRVMRVVA